MRHYKTEPQIWGGKDGCEHEFGDMLIKRKRGKLHGENAKAGNTLSGVSGISTTQGQFCLHCNAWRGELGLEPSPELYIEHLTEIFREIRRVLRKDGTCWIVIGDSYWGSGNNMGNKSSISVKQASNKGAIGQCAEHFKDIGNHPILKRKDLCLIPFHLAILFAQRLNDLLRLFPFCPSRTGTAAGSKGQMHPLSKLLNPLFLHER